MNKAMDPVEKLQKRADDWNGANPVGSPVIVSLDSGEKRSTMTRSKAQVLSGHHVVIWLEGITGCYDLDCVRRV